MHTIGPRRIGMDTTFTNNYTELFPSAAITYTFTPKVGLNVTYSRRIDRPARCSPW